MKALALLLTLLTTNLGYAQTKIDAALMREDLDVLKANLEAYHTGLYTYTSKETFDAWFSDAKASSKALSSQAFFDKVNELNALIKNGHTGFYLNPAQRDSNLHMPAFTVHRVKDSFFVRSIALKEHQDLVGKQLLSIDGKPFAATFQGLLKYKKRDGNNQTQPMAELGHTFANCYAYAYGSSPQSTLELIDKGETVQVEVPTIPFQITEALTDARYERGKIKTNVTDGVAYLDMPTFWETPLKANQYKATLKTFFKTIAAQNIEHLIVDVRNNGGGSTGAVEELLSYLLDQKFTFYQDIYQVHKKWDHAIIPEVHHVPDATPSWLLKAGDDGNYRAIGGNDGTKPVAPKKEVFKGNLYVLINGNSLSAAAEFAAYIKNYREVTLIGEEAGGNKLHNTSGIALQIGLPHSKIIAEIPIILWKMNVSWDNDGHGIVPDHQISNSIQNELDGTDAVLDFTHDFIQNSARKGK